MRSLRKRQKEKSPSAAALQADLQRLMWDQAGPFRTADKLASALDDIKSMQEDDLPQLRIGNHQSFNLDLQDWFELRAMLTTAEAVVACAWARTESRGAHQREDFPETDPALEKNQVIKLKEGNLTSTGMTPLRLPIRG
jgi:succinate dehydrogenase / fumarate reductase flavoprotein subunit